MTVTHMHLLLNHFPVIGTILVIALLGFAIMRNSSELTKVSLGLLVGLAVVAVIVYLTGEPAKEAIEKLPGYSEAVTERHEEFALVATIVLGAVGSAALILLLWMRKHATSRWMMISSLVMSLVAGGMMGYTAMLGGQVRHTEVRSGSSAAPVTGEHDDG